MSISTSFTKLVYQLFEVTGCRQAVSFTTYGRLGLYPKKDLGDLTHTLVPCWMSTPLPPRNQCMGWFTLAVYWKRLWKYPHRTCRKSTMSSILGKWPSDNDAYWKWSNLLGMLLGLQMHKSSKSLDSNMEDT